MKRDEIPTDTVTDQGAIYSTESREQREERRALPDNSVAEIEISRYVSTLTNVYKVVYLLIFGWAALMLAISLFEYSIFGGLYSIGVVFSLFYLIPIAINQIPWLFLRSAVKATGRHEYISARKCFRLGFILALVFSAIDILLLLRVSGGFSTMIDNIRYGRWLEPIAIIILLIFSMFLVAGLADIIRTFWKKKFL